MVSVDPVVALVEEVGEVFSSIFIPSVVLVKEEEEEVSVCPPSIELVVSVPVEDEVPSVPVVPVE